MLRTLLQQSSFRSAVLRKKPIRCLSQGNPRLAADAQAEPKISSATSRLSPGILELNKQHVVTSPPPEPVPLTLPENIKMDGKEKAQFAITLAGIHQEFIGYGDGDVELVKDDISGVATIRLNRPDKKNALTGVMLTKLADAVTELEEWHEGKLVILESAGSCFCAGMDLCMVRQLRDKNGGSRLATYFKHISDRIQALPMITVAVVQGAVIGGGAELITAFDFRLLTPKAEVQFVHLKMGVVPGLAGGGTRLVHLVGPSRALQLLMTAERVSAQRALEIGLANALIEEGQDPVEASKSWLKTAISVNPQLVQTMKAVVKNATRFPMDRSMDIEKVLFLSVWGKPTMIRALDRSRHSKP